MRRKLTQAYGTFPIGTEFEISGVSAGAEFDLLGNSTLVDINDANGDMMMPYGSVPVIGVTEVIAPIEYYFWACICWAADTKIATLKKNAAYDAHTTDFYLPAGKVLQMGQFHRFIDSSSFTQVKVTKITLTNATDNVQALLKKL